ncbi:MAG TPA: transketolase [Thermodesulfobacteriota bacterium]|nr:transketolase [Thermodesulfobacteriota bacterium]
MHSFEQLKKLAGLIRYYSLISTTAAGSGHPSSSLSATDLMAGLFFGGFYRFDLDHPNHPNNDRLLFSKGHASPLLYALYAAAGRVSEEELLSLRKFDSPLEGHPSRNFRYTEAATGSLGQGLSIGLGMALNARYLDKLSYRTFVLLGDSEMSEGSQWEAMQIAAHYKLNNLIGIIDVNRLGQRGETLYGHNLEAYQRKADAFGWETHLIDGHDFEQILAAYEKALRSEEKPVMIIARTIKGKGVSLMEDQNGWHGKALNEAQLKNAVLELGEIDKSIRGEILKPEDMPLKETLPKEVTGPFYPPDKPVATRLAYGQALKRIFPFHPGMVVLDAEVSNSTYSEIFKEAYPEHFFEMYIAEQNMVGTALGLSLRGKIPFISTFAAFFSRAFDQIRMSQYSKPNIKFCGSHAGVSIGEDGPSQMGLEDLAMFRAVSDSVVLYPSDALSTEHLVEEAACHCGLVYIRTTRMATPILYSPTERFPIGGSKVLRRSREDRMTVVAAGITLFEALKAYEELKTEGIYLRLIDLYSIKPLDESTLKQAARETEAIITVEDHYPEGGLGEAVKSALSGEGTIIHSLAVRKKPGSGKPEELLAFEEISREAIIKKVRELMGTRLS